MRKTANPQQKKSIGQAALFIGTCSVAAADTQITSSESQVLKRNQLLAGIQCRRVLNVIFRIPSNARVESQAKPINRRILRRTGYELTLWMRVGRISASAGEIWSLRPYRKADRPPAALNSPHHSNGVAFQKSLRGNMQTTAN
jgi:hypothetical protein